MRRAGKTLPTRLSTTDFTMIGKSELGKIEMGKGEIDLGASAENELAATESEGKDFPQRAVAASGRQYRVLFCEGSSLSARQTLYAIGRKHQVELIDASRFCQCRFSSLLRRWTVGPSFGKDPLAFLRFLATHLRRRPADVLLPTHEQVFLLARAKGHLESLVGVALPSFEALQQLQGKAAFSRILDQLAIPQPATQIVSSLEELDRSKVRFPCYLKLDYSTAGCGVFFVPDQSAWHRTLQRVAQQLTEPTNLPQAGLDQAGLDQAGSPGGWSRSQAQHPQGLTGSTASTPRCEILIQQPATGQLCTAQVLFQNGRLLAAHCFRALATGFGGMSTDRQSVHHPEAVEHLRRLGEYLQWHGPAFFDYFYDPDHNRTQFLEANPRLGETVNAMQSGLNLADLLVRMSAGEPVAEQPLGRAGVRTVNRFMILNSAVVDRSSWTQLFRQWWKLWVDQGEYWNYPDEITRPWEDSLSLIPSWFFAAQALTLRGFIGPQLRQAIRNYALTPAAAARISQLSEEQLQECFA